MSKSWITIDVTLARKCFFFFIARIMRIINLLYIDCIGVDLLKLVLHSHEKNSHNKDTILFSALWGVWSTCCLSNPHPLNGGILLQGFFCIIVSETPAWPQILINFYVLFILYNLYLFEHEHAISSLYYD